VHRRAPGRLAGQAPIAETPEGDEVTAAATRNGTHRSPGQARQTPPPRDEAAERYILSCILRHGAAPTVMRQLHIGHLAGHHQYIYAALADLTPDGRAVDLTMLHAELVRRGRLQDIGGDAYLAQVWDAAATDATLPYHLGVVATRGAAASATRICTEAIAELQGPAADPGEVIERVTRALLDARPRAAEARRPSHHAYVPMPTAALPAPLRRYAVECAATLACDPAYVALPCLAVVASCIGNSRTIRLRRGWDEPAVIWAAPVGDSGTRKSPAYQCAVGPLLDIQHRLFGAWEQAQARYEMAVEEHRLASRTRGRGAPGEIPSPPPQPRLVVSDTTIERLAEVLSDSPRGVLLARDELAGWLGSYERYRRAGGSDLPTWLEMHRAGSIIVDRKTVDRRPLRVRHAAVSVVGTIQPAALARALTPEALEVGLGARLLLAAPPRQPKTWTDLEVDPETTDAYTRTLGALLDLQLETAADGEQHPVALPLSPAGREVWVEWYGRWAEQQAAADGHLAAAMAKLEGYAARLALVHHLVEGTTAPSYPDAVQAESVAAGCELAEWFAAETRRLYATLTESAAERDARRLVEWIAGRGGSATARDVLRSGRYASAGEAEAALQQLVRMGLATWEARPAGPRGGQPTRICRVQATREPGDEG